VPPEDEPGKLYEARVYFKSFYGEEDMVIRIDLDVKAFDRSIGRLSLPSSCLQRGAEAQPRQRCSSSRRKTLIRSTR
jgi:hypothetical protein